MSKKGDIAMNRPMTLEELAKNVNDMVKQGHGKKYVYLTTDDEGNDYHALYFNLTTDTDTIKEYMASSISGLGGCIDVENSVLLG